VDSWEHNLQEHQEYQNRTVASSLIITLVSMVKNELHLLVSSLINLRSQYHHNLLLLPYETLCMTITEIVIGE
jgi:hypothetical protein